MLITSVELYLRSNLASKALTDLNFLDDLTCFSYRKKQAITDQRKQAQMKGRSKSPRKLNKAYTKDLKHRGDISEEDEDFDLIKESGTKSDTYVVLNFS